MTTCRNSLLVSLVFGLTTCSASLASDDQIVDRRVPDEAANDSLRSLKRLADAPAPDAKTRWARGEVEFAGQWTTPDAVARAVATDREHVAYRAQREKCPDTAEAHLQLALWCRAHGLAEEQRAHLLVAAHLDPADRRAFQLLGLKPYRGTWLTEEEIAAARQREAQIAESLRTWHTRLLALREKLNSADVATRTAAEDEILDIRDPFAIPELESLLSLHTEPAALLVIQTLNATPGEPASQSLARHAVWSESERVRQAAIESLQARKSNEFVPTLVEYLRPTRSWH